MEAFTRFLVTTAILMLKEIFVCGTLGSAVITPAGIKARREGFEEHIADKAEAEWLCRT
jgi:hypothetical protein